MITNSNIIKVLLMSQLKITRGKVQTTAVEGCIESVSGGKDKRETGSASPG